MKHFVISELELFNLVSHNGLFDSVSLVNYPSILKLFVPPYDLLIPVGFEVYTRKALRVRIETILGYDAEAVEKMTDEQLIEITKEHFVYTRPTSEVPTVIKDKPIKETKVKIPKVSVQKQAQSILQNLMSDPENIKKMSEAYAKMKAEGKV